MSTLPRSRFAVFFDRLDQKMVCFDHLEQGLICFDRRDPSCLCFDYVRPRKNISTEFHRVVIRPKKNITIASDARFSRLRSVSTAKNNLTVRPSKNNTTKKNLDCGRSSNTFRALKKIKHLGM